MNTGLWHAFLVSLLLGASVACVGGADQGEDAEGGTGGMGQPPAGEAAEGAGGLAGASAGGAPAGSLAGGAGVAGIGGAGGAGAPGNAGAGAGGGAGGPGPDAGAMQITGTVKDFTKTVLVALVSDAWSLTTFDAAKYDAQFGPLSTRKARADRLPALVFALASKAGAGREAQTLFWGDGRAPGDDCEAQIRGFAPQSPVTAAMTTYCSDQWDHAWESTFLYGFCAKSTISVSASAPKVTVCGKTLTARSTTHGTFSQPYIDRQAGGFLGRVPSGSLFSVVLMGGRKDIPNFKTYVPVEDTLSAIRDEGVDLQVLHLSTAGTGCQAFETASTDLFSFGKFITETGGKQFPYDCSNLEEIGNFVAGMIRGRNPIAVPLSPQHAAKEVERVIVGELTLAAGDWERKDGTLVVTKEPPQTLLNDTVKVLFR